MGTISKLFQALTAEDQKDSVGGFFVSARQYLTNSTKSTPIDFVFNYTTTRITTTTARTTTTTTTAPEIIPFSSNTHFLAPTVISLAIIIVLLGMVILRRYSRRSQFMSSEGRVVVVRTQSSQEEFRRLDNDTDRNEDVPTIYNPSMIRNEEPPDYDTLIEMELPSYEEITSKQSKGP